MINQSVSDAQDISFSGLWTRENRSRATIALVALGPIFAVVTVIALSQRGQGIGDLFALRVIFLVDLIYILLIATLVIWRMAMLLSARRAKSAGSRLHLRLVGVFTIVALAPTILVAVFATTTVSFGIEGWFSDRVGSVLENSLATARAYKQEHRQEIRAEVLAMANDLNRAGSAGASDAELVELLRAQTRLRGLEEAFVFDTAFVLRARGEFNYLFDFDPPTAEQILIARRGEVVLIEDQNNNEIRALVRLPGFIDYFLIAARRVDGEIFRLLDETEATVRYYNQLEGDRENILFRYAVVYLGFALIVVLAAIWLGLWFAERLSQPIGRLAGAAQRVGAGDLEVRVKESRGDDEIAVLSRVFNRMTEQVKGQRDALVEANAQTERRRQFMEAVLSGVTAGVIRLNDTGQIELINAAAARMLDISSVEAVGFHLTEVAPVFGPLLDQARARRSATAEDRLHTTVSGQDRDLLARIARTSADGLAEGYVLTFDDTTELVSAQRMAAWGDVARRIAHEIKNPLTPIQLSAERLKAKFAKQMGDGRGSFEQYTDMIVRQALDIRRMVDEFSKFARMPAPDLAETDLTALARDAVLLQTSADERISVRMEGEGAPILHTCDRGLISQALTNLLKNAGEAVGQRLDQSPEPEGRILCRVSQDDETIRIAVIDNGAGLPEKDRRRLTEPYVTTREKGTGLGLAIVKKIAEQHGGDLTLTDAPGDDETGPTGAMAILEFPKERQV